MGRGVWRVWRECGGSVESVCGGVWKGWGREWGRERGKPKRCLDVKMNAEKRTEKNYAPVEERGRRGGNGYAYLLRPLTRTLIRTPLWRGTL